VIYQPKCAKPSTLLSLQLVDHHVKAKLKWLKQLPMHSPIAIT
jgi:hypothetical protein